MLIASTALPYNAAEGSGAESKEEGKKQSGELVFVKESVVCKCTASDCGGAPVCEVSPTPWDVFMEMEGEPLDIIDTLNSGGRSIDVARGGADEIKSLAAAAGHSEVRNVSSIPSSPKGCWSSDW